MNPNPDLNRMFNGSQTPILFIDFDGTVSKLDVIDRILEEFAGPSWLEVEKRWLRGKIGSRQCLREQFSLVRATPEQMNEFLDTLELDDGFFPLLHVCREMNITVHIVSDGFDYYIRRLLENDPEYDKESMEPKIWANGLIPFGKNRWRTKYPYFRTVCDDGCATCKPRVMREQNKLAAPSIFIGDGLSDQFAAKTADIVFAKNKLSEFCLEHGFPQIAYSTLMQVAEYMDEALGIFALDSYKDRRWRKAA